MKKTLAIMLTVLLMLTLAACSNNEAAPAEKEARTAGSYNTVEVGDMVFSIPDYYENDETDSSDSITLFAETGEGLSMISLTPIDAQSDEEDFSANYENLVDEGLNTLFESSDADDSEKIKSSEFRTSAGLQASETDFLYHLVSDDFDVPLDGKLVMINNSDRNKVIMAYLLQSRYSEYDYIDGFMTMMDEAEVAEEPAESSSDDTGLLSPEFKRTMDDYEAWFDHYCEVMKKYEENSSDIELLSEMTTLLSEETTMLQELENMDQSEMNSAELAYYIEVTARIEKKLLEVAY